MTIGRCAHLTEPTAEHIALGRGPCQLRSVCERGCGYGAYFSTLSSTLPAAQRTGNLTVVTDAIVESLDYDHAKRRISGVRVIDANTKQRRSLPGARRVRVRLDDPDGADPARVAFGIFPERAREPLGRGRPLSHGSRAGHRRDRQHAGISRSLLLRPPADGHLHSALRERHRGPTSRTSCAASASRARASGRAGIAAIDEVGVGVELKRAARTRALADGAVRIRARCCRAPDNRVTLHDAQGQVGHAAGPHRLHARRERSSSSPRAPTRTRSRCWWRRAARTCAPVPAHLAAGQLRPRNGHRAHGPRSRRPRCSTATTRRTTCPTCSSPTGRA